MMHQSLDILSRTDSEHSKIGKAQLIQIEEGSVMKYEDTSMENVKPLTSLRSALLVEDTKPGLGLAAQTIPLVIRHSGGMPTVETKPDGGPLLTVRNINLSGSQRSCVKRPLCSTYDEKKSDVVPDKVPKLEDEISYLNRDIKKEPMTDYDAVLEDVKPDLKALQAAKTPMEETKQSLGLVSRSPPTPIVIRYSGWIPLDGKRRDDGPLLTVQKSLLSQSGSLRFSIKRLLGDNYSERKPDETSLPHVPKLVERSSDASQSRPKTEELPPSYGDINPEPVVPLPISLMRNSKELILFTYEQVPGLNRYPCLVCQYRKEPFKLREVKTADAHLMIYICFSDNVYSLEKALELAKMRLFFCCVHHLSLLYDRALYHLNVSNANVDLNNRNNNVVRAYNVISSFKDSRGYTNIHTDRANNLHVLPFCRSVQKFLANYCRKSYMTDTTVTQRNL